jgi:hypothetical protein
MDLRGFNRLQLSKPQLIMYHDLKIRKIHNRLKHQQKVRWGWFVNI